MDNSTFWNIIEAANRETDGDPEQLAEKVHAALQQLQPGEIHAFHSILCEKLRSSYSRQLWGAAYLINGGCSDDGFEYFRCWLISRGRAVFDAAIVEPDSLANVVDPDNDCHECESLLYVALKAYEKAAGMQMPRVRGSYPPEPLGENWDFDDPVETARRLPRLSELYNV